MSITTRNLKMIVAIAIAATAFGNHSFGQTHKGSGNSGGGSNQGAPQVKWTVNPFDYKVFIENRGQFDNDIQGISTMFSAHMGHSDAYFTKSGISYRYIEVPKYKQGQDLDEKGANKRTFHYAATEWVNSNPNVNIEPLAKENYYYTYGMDGNKTIKTDVYRKMIYHNLYPGIDAVYTFPADEGNVKKYGIKYSLIVHPGADLSQVKLRYTGVKSYKMNEKGDVVWQSDIKEITDHAPVTYYENEPTNTIASSYKVDGKEESFSINGDYDKSKTLVIDPWSTDPVFTTYDVAYIMDYDYADNVYVYGGVGYELVKFNSAGVKQWMYTATTLASTGSYLGGMCCDRKSENCYMSEGWNASGGGARTEKVNTSGVLLGTDPGNSSMDEIWRLAWDPCTHFIFGTGNGTCCPYQACQIDTNMVTEVIANICAPTVTSGGYHDFGALAVDPLGGYLFTANSQSLSYVTVFNNYLFKCPIPALVPATFQMPDHYAIKEFSTYTFDGSPTNGFSGAAVSPNWAYLYQGDTLKQFDKNLGTINAVAKISTTPYLWGGIAVDYCDNIYLGNSTAFQEYNSSLSFVNSTTLTGTIYDVKINGNVGWACGNGFVTALTITPPALPTISKVDVSSGCSGCNGSSTATLNLCSVPLTTGVTYLWSNGATTQTISSLCSGTYTVNITMGCNLTFTDTVKINSGGSGGFTLTTTQINENCNGAIIGSANVSVTGGTAPFTYSWSSGQTTTGITGLSAGSYTITVIDSGGCSGGSVVNITQPGLLTAPVSNITNEKCNGGSNGSLTVTASGGTAPYTYSWNNGQTSSNNSGLTIGTYTLTVTDSNGCTATVSASITQPSAIAASVTHTTTTCGGNNGTATATASGGSGAFTYSWAPSGGTNTTASGLSAGTYTCTVTDSNGCTQTVIAIINSSGGSTITPTIVDPLCNSGLGSATANVTGGLAPYTYSWAPSGGTNATASNLTAGTYTCTVTDANGCITIQTFTITVPIVLAESITGTTPANCGEPVGSASATASGGTGSFTYSWAPSGGTNATATGLTAGSYTCTVTDANGCIQTQVAVVPGTGALVPTISPNVTIYKGDSTVLGATGGGTYSWGPLTGLSCDSCPDPTATPTVTTTYTVTVDSAGCTASRVVVVTVDIHCADFVVPNVFTPNNDGINDDFVISVLNPSSYSIIIYDRWGKEVYTSSNPNLYWNGDIVNTQYLVPDGVYYYIVTASCGDNNYVKKGFVQVLGGK